MYKIKNKDVISADLLSVEDAKRLPHWILANGYLWWLRSTNDSSSYTAFISSDGFVYAGDCGCQIYTHSGVRPALKISNLPNLTIGETVEVFGFIAQYIGNDSVLLCDSVFYSRFDCESNVYENSEIKRKLDAWFKCEKGRNGKND